MSIYRITVLAQHSVGGAQHNIHHYEFPSYVPDETELNEACQDLADVYEEILAPRINVAVTLLEVEARRVDIGDQPSATYVPTGWPIPGENGDASLPTQIAAVIRWNAPTEFPRSGRTYLPSFGAGALGTFGNIDAGYVTALNGVAISLQTLPITGNTDARKVTVQYGGDPRAVIASNTLEARPTENRWGVQRRRRPGTGI
jgi:hypothetical protein